MKHLLSIMVVIGMVGLLVAPGLADDDRHSGRAYFGYCERWQYVTINFEHDTFYDVPLWPVFNNRDALEEIPGSGQWCQAIHNPGDPGVKLTRGVEGYNVLLVDLFCLNSDFTRASVEVQGLIIGELERCGKIYSKGKMVLDLNPFTGEMKGHWVLKKEFGTHHGVLYVEGTSAPYEKDGKTYYRGVGTYSGWIRENR